MSVQETDITRTDVCIVGGGMVGAALALKLAQSGLGVIVWERQRPVVTPGRLGMSLRTVALSPASEAWLGGLGLHVTGTPMLKMRVWEELGTATLRFDAIDVGEAQLGRIVENDLLVAALWDALDQTSGISVRLDAELRAVQPADGVVRLSGAEGLVEAKLCIAADGAASRVRELTGGSAKRFETGQSALATVVRTERPHEGCAWQRFLSSGPVALLPGREPDLSAVVWSQRPADADARRSLDDAQFCGALERATEGVLGTIRQTDARLVFPLVQQLAGDLCPLPRVVLAGDAARVLHPLAGMGVNLGFEDAALLADLCAGSSDPGDASLLMRYSRRRSLRSRSLVNLMSGFQTIYGWESPGPVWLRNLGVRWLDGQTFIKRQILREALGIGPVARLSH